MLGTCLGPWACEWSIGYLWRWTNWISRLHVYVLAVMFAYTLAAVIYMSCRCYSVRHELGTNDDRRRKLVVDLNIRLGNLKSIASTAPYLGLMGTCFGILNMFRGVGMERHAVMIMETTYAAAALITTAAGILVAVPAVFSQNYLCGLIEKIKVPTSPTNYPFAKRRSELPAFAVIAAPIFALAVLAFFSLQTSFRIPTTGLDVWLQKPSFGLTTQGSGGSIIVRLVEPKTSTPTAVYVNSKNIGWENLNESVQDELKIHPQSIAYVEAERGVSWAEIAEAIDVVKGGSQKVVLVTPNPKFGETRSRRVGDR